MNTKGPFGLTIGMKLEEIQGHTTEIKPFLYFLDSPPKPHPTFGKYIIKVAPKSGLSWVKVLGVDIKTSVYGHELRTAFEAMIERLSKVYGKCEKSDLLFHDSIWNEPKDFMMSLEQKERLLSALWSKSNKQSTLPENFDSVFLSVLTSGTDTGCLIIEYEFSNENASTEEIETLEDDVL